MRKDIFSPQDEYFMDKAIEMARKAFKIGDVPVGAVVVYEGEIIGKGFNKKEFSGDASAHAEMLAMQDACKRIGDWRLLGCKLYSTAEPCLMCAGAILHFRLEEVIFGVKEYKFGGVCSKANLFDLNGLNHRVKYRGGLKSEEIATLMQEFFRNIRLNV